MSWSIWHIHIYYFPTRCTARTNLYSGPCIKHTTVTYSHIKSHTVTTVTTVTVTIATFLFHYSPRSTVTTVANDAVLRQRLRRRCAVRLWLVHPSAQWLDELVALHGAGASVLVAGCCCPGMVWLLLVAKICQDAIGIDHLKKLLKICLKGQ